MEPNDQAKTLFTSLYGIPRQIFLSELPIEEIMDNDVVRNIIFTLYNFYLVNKTKSHHIMLSMS